MFIYYLLLLFGQRGWWVLWEWWRYFLENWLFSNWLKSLTQDTQAPEELQRQTLPSPSFVLTFATAYQWQQFVGKRWPSIYFTTINKTFRISLESMSSEISLLPTPTASCKLMTQWMHFPRSLIVLFEVFFFLSNHGSIHDVLLNLFGYIWIH